MERWDRTGDGPVYLLPLSKVSWRRRDGSRRDETRRDGTGRDEASRERHDQRPQTNTVCLDTHTHTLRPQTWKGEGDAADETARLTLISASFHHTHGCMCVWKVWCSEWEASGAGKRTPVATAACLPRVVDAKPLETSHGSLVKSKK